MRVLTGIKPTGRSHLGTYLGSIRPSLELAAGRESYFFIADLHALTTVREGARLRELSYDVAAAWLALGLDPEQGVFFRQSDVPEIPLLSWVLACYTSMGLLERAHAFKAARETGAEVNAGLFTYPVLMAADILAFRCTHVPVGQDQKQHVEIARDVALRFNHHHPGVLTVPEPVIREAGARVPGLDGRKMSKSHDNTLPLFAPPRELRERIAGIVTDSAPLEAPKDPETSTVYHLYRLLAPPDRAEDLAGRLRAGGTGWGHAKQALAELMEETFGPARAEYERLMASRGELDALFARGARRARETAAATLAEVRRAAGLAPSSLEHALI